jgi:hypothetical protein
MSQSVWYSPLFDNTSDGGVLAVMPYEAIGDWKGADDEDETYEEITDEIDQVLIHPLRQNVGLFLSDDDGFHEAYWMRIPNRPGITLAVWIEWNDPHRPSMPEDTKQVAQAWQKREDPRQAWLEKRLSQDDIKWERHDSLQSVESGVLLFFHAEENPLKLRVAKPRGVAKCGQYVPVGIPPGKYRIETTFINELPDGTNCCLVARWLPVDA